jgi:hypothetical protein
MQLNPYRTFDGQCEVQWLKKYTCAKRKGGMDE